MKSNNNNRSMHRHVWGERNTLPTCKHCFSLLPSPLHSLYLILCLDNRTSILSAVSAAATLSFLSCLRWLSLVSRVYTLVSIHL